MIVKLRIFLLQMTNATVSIHINGKTAANLEQPANSVRTNTAAAGTNPCKAYRGVSTATSNKVSNPPNQLVRYPLRPSPSKPLNYPQRVPLGNSLLMGVTTIISQQIKRNLDNL